MSAPHTQFFTGQMPFLPPNQQHQSTTSLTTFWRLMQFYYYFFSRIQITFCYAIWWFDISWIIMIFSEVVTLILASDVQRITTFGNCWRRCLKTSLQSTASKHGTGSHWLLGVWIASCVLYVCNFSKVADCLELKDTDLDLRSAVLLDYYVGAMWWCREQSYSAEQTSAFFTVIDTLFHNIGTYCS